MSYQKNPNDFTKYGNYNLKDITLTNSAGEDLDISFIFNTIDIYESISSPFISGSVSIIDANNIIDNFNIVGFENLHIDFFTKGKEDNSVELNFSVYKISEQEKINSTAKHYMLYFTTPEAIKNEQMKISRSYSGKYVDIMQNVYDEFESERELRTTETNDEMKFISAYWKPTQIFNYIVRHCYSDKYESSNYLFFESTRGFNFLPIEMLYENEDVKTLYRNPLIGIQNTDNTEQKEKNLNSYGEDRYFVNIENMKILKSSNTLEKISSGVFSNNQLNVDFDKHSYSYVDYNIDDNFVLNDKHTKPETVNINPLSNMHTKMFTVNFDENIDQQNRQKRLSMLSSVSDSNIVAVLSGDSDIEVGSIVEFDMVSIQANNKDMQTDKKISGKRIIINNHHSFTREKYTNIVEIGKDSIIS